MMENNMWEELYNRAKEVLKPRRVSENIDAGGVAAAILSKSGKFMLEYVLIQHVLLEYVQKEMLYVQ